MSRWNDPLTAAYYEAFCRRHSRYRRANRELVSHADIEPGMRVLDLAAGTGRTARAALSRLGERGRVVCVEPAAAMRAEGVRRVRDPRIAWRAGLPVTGARFDRLLCGAAIWQLDPLADALHRLGDLLRPRGALCFTIPALYLQEADTPGGGRDPLLLALPQRLTRTSPRAEADRQAGADEADRQAGPASAPAVPLTSALLTTWLRDAGFRCESWEFRARLTQAAYAEWLKIPVVSEGMLAGLTPTARARRIDAAMTVVDRSSWKWERWRGWTAWKT